MKKQIWERPFPIQLLLIILLPIIGLALGVAVTIVLNMNQADYGNLVVNLFYLLACLGLTAIFRFSRQDLGLQVNNGQIGRHVGVSLIIFTLYLLFYLFVIRISALKPFSAMMGWGLVTNVVVVLAEELYFRGMLYSFIQKRFSARAALVVTAVLFGFFHAQQGLRGIINKTFTGWLWGSVRYSSGMTFLLIFPVHYAFNTIWLLFEGKWNNPPAWAFYLLAAGEFLLGLAIVLRQDRRAVIHEQLDPGLPAPTKLQ